jgi:hypothetical protein
MSEIDAQIRVRRLPDMEAWEFYEIRTVDDRQAGVVGLRFYPDTMQVEYAAWESSEAEEPKFVEVLDLDSGQLDEPGYAAACLRSAIVKLCPTDSSTPA